MTQARYDVTALFDRPVNGRVSVCSADREYENVFAESPESAARKWLHSLPPEEKAATVRLLITAPVVEKHIIHDVYKGPVIEYMRLGGRLDVVLPDGKPPGARHG
jgi:hypothetical protein